ncbi:hypothetical protein RA210_U40295 [Rubrivivax sp. A210]|nr:hypothetical protein RA210_U40295 [Rubrivivax sp. A210]
MQWGGRSAARRAGQEFVLGLAPGALPVQCVTLVQAPGGHGRGWRRAGVFSAGDSGLRLLPHPGPVGGLAPGLVQAGGRALFADESRRRPGTVQPQRADGNQANDPAVAAVGRLARPHQAPGGHDIGALMTPHRGDAATERNLAPGKRPPTALGAGQQALGHAHRRRAQIRGGLTQLIAQALFADGALPPHRGAHRCRGVQASRGQAGGAKSQLGAGARNGHLTHRQAQTQVRLAGERAAEGGAGAGAEQPEPPALAGKQQVDDLAAVVAIGLVAACRYQPQRRCQRHEVQRRAGTFGTWGGIYISRHTKRHGQKKHPAPAYRGYSLCHAVTRCLRNGTRPPSQSDWEWGCTPPSGPEDSGHAGGTRLARLDLTPRGPALAAGRGRP